MGFVLIGVVLRAWSQTVLRAHGIDTAEQLAGTSIPREWATHGPYRLLRHPLYTGHLLVIAGVGIAALGPGGIALALAALPHYQRRAVQESAARRHDEAARKVRRRLRSGPRAA
jgi:protein-S-isoprenylcysteine O-methyltransferase Ste14